MSTPTPHPHDTQPLTLAGDHHFRRPRCSRTKYVVLALLTGWLGVHSFVAGYRSRGLVQLGITVASLGLLAPAAALWAIAEAIAIRHDGDGVAFVTPPRQPTAAPRDLRKAA